MRDKLIRRIEDLQQKLQVFVMEDLRTLSNEELMDILEELAIEKFLQEDSDQMSQCDPLGSTGSNIL